MPMTTTVRRAIADDAGALARLTSALGYPTTTEQMEDRLLTLHYDDDHAVLVALVDGRVTGFAHVCTRAGVLADLSLELAALVVDERSRGRGIGRALLGAVHALARERGLDLVRVSSNVVRERAHRFYEENGYARAKVQVVLTRRV